MRRTNNRLVVVLLLTLLIAFTHAQQVEDYLPCSPSTFYCTSKAEVGTLQCIDMSKVCNGVMDCPDSSDETYSLCVVNNTCVHGLFTCSKSLPVMPVCILNSSVCNGVNNCAKGEDEQKPYCFDNKCSADSFHCTNTSCVPQSVVCDGVSDCPFGLDETNCPARVCPANSTFTCAYGYYCINMTLICNGIWDCRDGSDETLSLCNAVTNCTTDEFVCSYNKPGEQCINMEAFCDGRAGPCPSFPFTPSQCDVDECLPNSPCGNNSYCMDLLIGYKCVCNTGYKLNADKKTCSEIDECNLTPPPCSQMCTNYPGGYNCSCVTGYEPMTSSNESCQRLNNSITPWLYLGNSNAVDRMLLNGSNLSTLTQDISFVCILDFDWQTQRIFHFDITLNHLSSVDFDGNNEQILDTLYAGSVEGIAIDWVHRKLLWTSTELMGIYISEMSGLNVYPLVSVISPRARGIAVHPDSAFVYWTDWSAAPFIARVGLDGSSLVKLVVTNIIWPNGITIDYSSDRFWWVDGNLGRIEYANLDGSFRTLLATSGVVYPYSITVFESNIYWTDWKLWSINTTNKYTAIRHPSVMSFTSKLPYDIKVIHPLRQPTSTVRNLCASNNGNCSHLCLPSPGGSYVCACPEAKPLMADGRTCMLGCTVAQFQCNDGSCIPWYYKCNGEKECVGGEDEPPTCPARSCSYNLFECSNASAPIYDKSTHMIEINETLCISQTMICDGIDQCSDGSDEIPIYCKARVCEVYEFLCWSTGKCIPLEWQCNGVKNCSQGEDEAPVNPACVSVCNEYTQFTCTNGQCIPAGYYCDIDNDCGDDSDEPMSSNNTCFEYRNANPCGIGYKGCPHSYRCIPITSFCDGINNCRDWSDEYPENCLPCPEPDFTCNNKYCIPTRWMCDYVNDCGDNSDENVTMCTALDLYTNCTSAEFRCTNNKCINIRLRCNGNNDCGDDSDEIRCNATSCASGMFICLDNQCIAQSERCNGFKDCADASDELNCPPRYPNNTYCPTTEFTCNNTVCIDMPLVCDGFDWCGDGSDESPAACNLKTCPPNAFQCQIVRNCIPITQLCDGVMQCEFGDDEACPGKCGVNFMCLSTKTCINRSLVCDLKWDCTDGSDEANCYESTCSVCQQYCSEILSSNGTILGNICSCATGFTVDEKDTRLCLGLDECAKLSDNWCPQICLDEKTTFNLTYKCLCAPGFTDVFQNGLTCLPVNDLKGTILYSLSSILLANNLTTNSLFIVNKEDVSTADVIAIDVDAINKNVYWITEDVIYRAAIPQNNKQMSYVQVVRNVTSATGIAYDWITGNVYWTETSGVYVTSESVYWLRTTLVSRNSSNTSMLPASIIVNPSIGMLFFINTYSTMPAIMSMTMSGTGLTSIVSSNLYIPTGLAVDLVLENRIFWADRGLKVIESCLPDGSDRTLHLTDVDYPYQLDVFAGRIYWTVFTKDMIKIVDHLGQGNISVFLAGQTDLGPLRFEHILKYNGYTYNMCSISPCTQCLLGTKTPRCTCPDGYMSNQQQQCNIQPPPFYQPLGTPSLCSCFNGGQCEPQHQQPICFCSSGFTGSQCETALTMPPTPKPTPTSASTTTTATTVGAATYPPTPEATAAITSRSPTPEPPTTTTTTTSSTTTTSPTTITTTAAAATTTIVAPPLGSISTTIYYIEILDIVYSYQNTLAITLPIVITVFLLVCILLGILAYKRGLLTGRMSRLYTRQRSDVSSIGSCPASPAPTMEPVIYHRDSVLLGTDGLDYTNPMYREMAAVLEVDSPPPYLYSDGGYDQDEDKVFKDSYDQEKKPQFTAFMFDSSHTDA